MASYATIPQTTDEAAAAPLMSQAAPKAAHKSAAVVAAVCLLSAVAGFNNHAISNTLFYKSGQLYLHAEPDGKELCLSVKDKEPVRGAKLQIWNCDDMVGKKFTKTYTSGNKFNLEFDNSGMCVVGNDKGFGDGSQFYLQNACAEINAYECKRNDSTQQFSMDRNDKSGRHLYWEENDSLCLTARGTREGDKVEAKKCTFGSDEFQKWAFE